MNVDALNLNNIIRRLKNFEYLNNNNNMQKNSSNNNKLNIFKEEITAPLLMTRNHWRNSETGISSMDYHDEPAYQQYLPDLRYYKVKTLRNISSDAIRLIRNARELSKFDWNSDLALIFLKESYYTVLQQDCVYVRNRTT